MEKPSDTVKQRAGLTFEGAEREFGLPVGIAWQGDEPVVTWCDFQQLAFTDPFFSDTYERLRATRPGLRTWVTGGAELMETATRTDGIEISGLIFHMGRCGSTLVSRVLAASERLRVLSEPDPMVGMLDFPASVSDTERRDWVRALVSVLAKRRRTSEAGCVVKLTSYHVLHLNLILEAFPRTPWLFVCRDPGAVLRSSMRRPPGFMSLHESPHAVARLLDITPGGVADLEPEEYLVLFLRRMLGVVLEHQSDVRAGRAKVVDHERLPASIWDEIAPFFGMVPGDDERARMAALSLLHSKDPTSQKLYRAVPEEAAAAGLDPSVEPAVPETLARRYLRVRALAGGG